MVIFIFLLVEDAIRCHSMHNYNNEHVPRQFELKTTGKGQSNI
jgi:hypothetical protein